MIARYKRFLKAVIAVVVAAGLVVAVQKSVSEWNHQQQLAIAHVTELKGQLENSESPPERQALLREIKKSEDAVPRLSNFRWWALVLATALYGLSLIPGGLVLRSACSALGSEPPVKSAIEAQISGHLGKYVPGKAMVVVIRAGRLAESGVPLLVGSVSVFIETLSMMAVGSAAAGLIIFCLPGVPGWIGWCALIGGLTASLPTFPPILRRITTRIQARQRSEPAEITSSAAEPAIGAGDKSLTSASETPDDVNFGSHGWRLFSALWGWQLVAWLLIGGSFALILHSIPGESASGSPVMVLAASVASIALAMVVGFASLLPGGAGVRELTLTIILAPAVGESCALLAAIVARLLFLTAELTAAGAVSVFRGREDRNQVSIKRNLT